VVVDIQGITEIPLYILIALSIICMIISIGGYFKIFSKHVKGEVSDNETLR
jgi:hypothetical protein